MNWPFTLALALFFAASSTLGAATNLAGTSKLACSGTREPTPTGSVFATSSRSEMDCFAPRLLRTSGTRASDSAGVKDFSVRATFWGASRFGDGVGLTSFCGRLTGTRETFGALCSCNLARNLSSPLPILSELALGVGRLSTLDVGCRTAVLD